MSSDVGDLAGAGDDRLVRVDQRRMRRGIARPAKMCSPRQSTPASISPWTSAGTRSGIDPERARPRAHRHPAILDRERRVDPDRDLRPNPELLAGEDGAAAPRLRSRR